MLLSLQKGITTPADWSSVIVLRFLSAPISHTPTCRSLIRLKPVVAMRSRSPIQTTRAPLMPPWPSATRTASPPVRGSNRRSLRSREVVARSWPVGLNARLWMASPWPASTARGDSGAPRSHSFTVWSPTALARTCCAAGCQRTWPTLRCDALMCSTGEKSTGVQPSAFHPSKALASTCHMSTLPSSPPDATVVSECGDQSVSSTGAVWLRARGIMSGSLYGIPGAPVTGEGAGRMANAPPPEAFQFTLMYFYNGMSIESRAASKQYAHQMRIRRLYPRHC